MPKYVDCPVCNAEVKVPRDAEPGDVLTCPDCAEEFTPPHLKPKGYDPRTAAGYGVGGGRDDEDDEDTHERRERKRKTRAYQKAGREYERDTKRTAARPFFGGVEITLLVFAAVVTVALGIGFGVAKRFPKAGEAAMIVFVYVGMIGFLALRKFVTR